MNDEMPARDQQLQQAKDDLATQVAVSAQQHGASLADRAELRHTLEYGGIATWKLFLPEGRFEWSENAHVLHGLAPDAAIERLEDWLERVHPDDRPALATLAEEAASSVDADQHEEWEYRIIGTDGFVRWFSGRGEIERREDGHLVVSGVAIDRLRLEGELRLREQMLSALLAASPDAILVAARDGRVTFASGRVHDIFGFEAEEMLGRSPREFLTDEGDHLLFPDAGEVRLRGGDSTDHLRVDVRHREGHVVTVDVRIGELASDDGGYVAVVRDVTDQARLERELARAKKEADAANLAKSEYLSRMSHELRTPMNTVLGFSQLLQLSELAPEDQENVARILRAGSHLLALIDDVLDIARIEAGNMDIALGPVPIGTIVSEGVELIQPQARERDITVELPDDCGSWPYAHANRQRLSQIIINLLSNAVKYNRPGGDVHLSCTEVGEGRHRIAVSDTGYGIADEELDRAFTPFDRLGADRGEVTGTGLGLALSKHLAEAMGGEMGCESTHGEGSTFWIDVREAAAPSVNEAPDPAEAVTEDPSHVTGTVLYIEDNAMNVELLRGLFARSPRLDLLHAPSGEDGIALASERRPDLVLLDLDLPGTSGREVLRHLRAQEATRALPVVVVSADATTTSTAELMAAGADGYVTKPFNLAELQDMVARTLATARGAGGGATVGPLGPSHPKVR